MAGKLWAYVGSPSVNPADIRALSGAGALLLDAAIQLAPHLGGMYLIGRDTVAFPDNVYVGASEAEAYDLGVARGHDMLARWPQHLSARMGPNEPHPQSIAGARILGAFEAGVASVVWAAGEDYVGGNFAVGTPEAPIICAWLRAFWQHYRPTPETRGRRFVLGFHGYSDWLTDAYWRELRPWRIWKPALEAEGLQLPPVIMTEAGLDTGETDYQNGYKANGDLLSAEEYADYLFKLPELAPECEAFCVYIDGTIDEAKWGGFDYSDDAVVKAGMIAGNARNDGGGTAMSNFSAADRDALWARHEALVGAIPMFDKVRLEHPELGDPLGPERSVNSRLVREFVGGFIYADPDTLAAHGGDWRAITKVAHTKEEMALPL